jgi:hypothetical protein
MVLLAKWEYLLGGAATSPSWVLVDSLARREDFTEEIQIQKVSLKILLRRSRFRRFLSRFY